MPVRKRSTSEKPSNGLYVHSSPPKVLQFSSAHIKQIIRSGDIERMEQLILDGQGKKLIGETSSDYRTRTFLKSVPALVNKINFLHDAVNNAKLEELQELLEEDPDKKRKLVMCKDEAGVGLLHKAVYHDLKKIYRWLIQNFPALAPIKDSEGRTAYHYTAMCKDPIAVQKMLVTSGADPTAVDLRGHTAKYYTKYVYELELPSIQSPFNSAKKQALKEGLNFKKSNIRIWIHQRNLANLQQVVWEGHGSKLLVEHSNNSKIKKFLEAVPHIMGLIRDIHTDVINGNLENLQKHVSPPIPKIVLSGKDSNGLTIFHKAAGLGKQDIVEYLLKEYPENLNTPDNDGRTPLHFSALLKDDSKMSNFLIENGADESALDSKQKTAAYYKTRHNEIHSKLLTTIPECPRTAKESFISTFDWNTLNPTPKKDVNKNEENGEKTTENGDEPTEEATDNNNEEQTPSAEEAPAIENQENEEQPEENGDTNNNEEPENTEEPTTEEQPEETVAEPEPEPAEEETNEGTNPEPENEENTNQSRPASTINSITRPSSKADNVSRPSSQAQSRPASEAKSRPISRAPSRAASRAMSRPASEMQEKEMQEKSGSGKREDTPVVDSEEVIEGVVNGEDEVETLNNDGQDKESEENDEEIKAMVEEGNMEQLAGLVLNGEGDKLVGQKSDNPELQSFLDNVPIYMSKINRIHVAAREGSLRDLQAALDRRKFAVAKDPISPKGTTPLHVAVVFGNTSIVRYLAGRFPETIQMVDVNGRTPLHYAATLADNGHYYNLLVHLGADTRIQDKLGHSADYYRTHQDQFSHNLLLKEFGAEENSDEMLNDKSIIQAQNGQVDMPFFATEEGRYLASSLGDPLIKGLTEVANKRPEDPIAYLAQYLYNFANNRSSNNKSRGRTYDIQQISGPPATGDDNNAIPASIDVVTVEPDENDEDSAFSNASRDEHGQSMLHFAAARAHGRNALFQLLLETEINVAFRDELYRTARDISIQANIVENTQEIDRYVLHVATKGDTDKLVELLLDGYDHITDIVDEEDVGIVEAVAKHNQPDTVSFLQSILAFEEKRERVHHAIRQGSLSEVSNLLADENDTGSGKLLAIGKNSYGRCSLHIAVLCQQEEIVDYLANTFKDTLKLGDNLERTALHYAMGVEKMETISRVLIKAGAKRIVKDLKGRQPTYYFLNKSEILRLQEEEETF